MTDLALSKDVILVDGMAPIIAVRLPDGELSATLRSLCELLDLDRRGQFRRIHRSPSLAQALQEATISTPGGPQQTEVLLNWAIAIWAAGLHVSRLPEAKRAAALILQHKAFAAIEQAFIQPEDDTTFQPPPTQPPAPQSVWQEGHAFIDHLRDHFEGEHERLRREVHEELRETRNQLAVVQYDQRSQALHLAALEAGNVRPGAGLSGHRLEYIYQRAHQISLRRGYSIAETLGGLADHFHVNDIYYLPESAWPAVLDWFASLLEEW